MSPLGFKARVGPALFTFVEVNVMYIPWDPPLVLHPLTSSQSASQPVTSPHASAVPRDLRPTNFVVLFLWNSPPVLRPWKPICTQKLILSRLVWINIVMVICSCSATVELIGFIAAKNMGFLEPEGREYNTYFLLKTVSQTCGSMSSTELIFIVVLIMGQQPRPGFQLRRPVLNDWSFSNQN